MYTNSLVKSLSQIRSSFFIFLLIFVSANIATAQTSRHTRVTISVNSDQIKVEAELSAPSTSWSFRNAYAGVLGIAERVDDFRAITGSGQDARATKIATGEFRSALDATRIAYQVRLSEINAASVSHVSWLSGDYGVLMFADLLPQDLTNLSVDFELPNG